jgi:isoleucyl-tRNA synthetase
MLLLVYSGARPSSCMHKVLVAVLQCFRAVRAPLLPFVAEHQHQQQQSSYHAKASHALNELPR